MSQWHSLIDTLTGMRLLWPFKLFSHIVHTHIFSLTGILHLLSSMANVKLDWIIGGKYRILRQIGVGSFGASLSFTIESVGAQWHTGEIYAGYDIHSGEEVAIKLEPCANGYLHLENEYKSYQLLGHRHTGIPQMKWFGIMEGYTAMALSLLGPSLEELFISNNCKFTLGKVLIIADQMVCLIAINCMALHDLTTLVAIVDERWKRLHA